MNIRSITPDQAPMHLLLDADPSESKVKKYLADSDIYIAEESGRIIGVAVLYQLKNGIFELMNIAVDPKMQAKGVGSKLLRFIISETKNRGAKRLELGTGTFGYQLSFYQKAGFRVYAVDRDFFLNNYDQPIFECGIQLKDMLRLAIDF